MGSPPDPLSDSSAGRHGTHHRNSRPRRPGAHKTAAVHKTARRQHGPRHDDRSIRARPPRGRAPRPGIHRRHRRHSQIRRYSRRPKRPGPRIQTRTPEPAPGSAPQAKAMTANPHANVNDFTFVFMGDVPFNQFPDFRRFRAGLERLPTRSNRRRCTKGSNRSLFAVLRAGAWTLRYKPHFPSPIGA